MRIGIVAILIAITTANANAQYLQFGSRYHRFGNVNGSLAEPYGYGYGFQRGYRPYGWYQNNGVYLDRNSIGQGGSFPAPRGCVDGRGVTNPNC